MVTVRYVVGAEVLVWSSTELISTYLISVQYIQEMHDCVLSRDINKQGARLSYTTHRRISVMNHVRF